MPQSEFPAHYTALGHLTLLADMAGNLTVTFQTPLLSTATYFKNLNHPVPDGGRQSYRPDPDTKAECRLDIKRFWSFLQCHTLSPKRSNTINLHPPPIWAPHPLLDPKHRDACDFYEPCFTYVTCLFHSSAEQQPPRTSTPTGPFPLPLPVPLF